MDPIPIILVVALLIIVVIYYGVQMAAQPTLVEYDRLDVQVGARGCRQAVEILRFDCLIRRLSC